MTDDDVLPGDLLRRHGPNAQPVDDRRIEVLRLAVAVATSPQITFLGSPREYIIETAGRFEQFLTRAGDET